MNDQDVDWPTPDELDDWVATMSNWGRWGDDDQRGALNLITPEKTRSAAALVQTGITVSCARSFEFAPKPVPDEAPIPPVHFMHACGDPHPDHPTTYASDWVGMPLHGLYITHLDAPSHVFWKGRSYNGMTTASIRPTTGALRGAIESAAGGLVSRGVLLDIPALRGDAWLEAGHGVTEQDLLDAEAAAGVHVAAGDIVMVRTGYGANRPGPRLGYGLRPGCVRFFAERDVSIIATDCGTDVHTSDPDLAQGPVHVVSLVALGVWIVDNCELERLSRHCSSVERWEFLMSINALRLKNSTGSPVNPVAVF